MKKLLVLILAVIMTIALAACSGTATPATPTQAPAAETPAAALPTEEAPAESTAPEDVYPQLTGETGTYKAGVYEETVRGIGGDIVFHITFSKDAITAIEAVKQHETEGLGSKALENVIPAIIEAQSTEVDGWSGATVTSNAIKDAVNTAMEEALA